MRADLYRLACAALLLGAIVLAFTLEWGAHGP